MREENTLKKKNKKLRLIKNYLISINLLSRNFSRDEEVYFILK